MGLEVAAVITAAAGLLGWLTDGVLKRRAESRAERVDPLVAVASSAATLAGALDAVVGPLRQDVAALRAEVSSLRVVNARLERRVAALTSLLTKHGIPVPEEKEH